jgi:vitamin B12 transporter
MLRVKSNECKSIDCTAAPYFIPAFYSFFNLKPFKMKKEKKVWALTLLAFWWLTPNTSNAQQKDSVRTLDEVTITATRMEQPVITAPRSVSVISGPAIEKSVYNSVADLLSAEAGIFIIGSTQTPGTNQSIFMRGANSNQTVVMIDGLRISDPSSPNGAIDLSEISLTDVERVEIIRGSHSTLYGGSAIGGAINIITKKAGAKGFHGSVNLQAGTFGDKSFAGSGTANLGYRFGNGWYVNGSVFQQNVRGLNATEDTLSGPGFKTADKDDFEKQDLYFKTGYGSAKGEFFIAGKRTDQHADIDDRSYDDDDNAFLDFNRGMIEYYGSYHLSGRLRLALTGSYSKSKRLLRNDSSLVNENAEYDHTFSEGIYHSQSTTNELVAEYGLGTATIIAGGGNYREEMDFNTFYFSNAFGFPFESRVNYDTIDTSASTTYLFGQVSVNIGKLNLKAGSRFNAHSRSGNFFTFEFNPSYQLGSALLYASLSTGYNAPSLYQLFDPTAGSDPALTRGNKNLKAEKSVSTEIGMKKEYNDGSYFTLSAYSTSISDDIEYVYLWDSSVPQSELTYAEYVGDKYLNISRQVISGVELSGRLNAGKWYVQGNVSAMKGKITIREEDVVVSETHGHHVQLYNYGAFVGEDIDVNSLARRPRFNAYGELGFKPNARLTAYTALRHIGPRNDVEYNAGLGPFGALGERGVDRYTLIDAGVNYQLTNSFAVHAKIENIADNEYREIYGFQTRGRSGYLKLIFKW